jgi:hypothetical protein
MQLGSLRTRARRLKAWLVFGGSFTLHPYEVRALQEWRGALDEEGKRLLDAQLRMLDRYKRQANNAVVSFFSTEVPYASHLPDHVRFPLREDESRVAVVTLRFGTGRSMKAGVVLTAGELLSLEFDRTPGAFTGLTVSEASVEILRDVMSVSPPSRPAPSEAELRDLLGEKAALARDLRAPLHRSARDAVLKGLEGTLPARYLRLMEITDGVRVGRLKVHGLTDVWSAPRPDGIYYVLGAVGSEADLAVRRGDASQRIYWLDHEADAAKPLDGDLLDIVDRYGV